MQIRLIGASDLSARFFKILGLNCVPRSGNRTYGVVPDEQLAEILNDLERQEEPPEKMINNLSEEEKGLLANIRIKASFSFSAQQARESANKEIAKKEAKIASFKRLEALFIDIKTKASRGSTQTDTGIDLKENEIAKLKSLGYRIEEGLLPKHFTIKW